MNGEEVQTMYWISGVLGLALIVAPFALGFSGNSTALWSSIVLGAAVAVVSAIKGLMHDTARWEYWVVGILGLAVVVAPFALGFSALHLALWSSIILGAIVAALSGYQLVRTPVEAR
jgi:hypothetical protein